MMDAIDKYLVPHGVTVQSKTKSSLSTIPDTAGGYFIYLRLPPDLPQAKAVAAVALHEHDVRVAFGDLFTVYGDESSAQRAAAQDDVAFGRCIRLCWAWHEADDIREAIERLGTALGDVRVRTQKGEEIGAGYSIGLR
jgi:DNA-binding transcriptional MocR family regulator